MPTGYMPARKKPVRNLNISMLSKVLSSHISPALNMAPIIAHIKNTLAGEKRSAIFNMANSKVPIINPNCTEMVIVPRAASVRLKLAIKLGITPLLANQSVVQQNWEITIVGRMSLCWFILYLEGTN